MYCTGGSFALRAGRSGIGATLSPEQGRNPPDLVVGCFPGEWPFRGQLPPYRFGRIVGGSAPILLATSSTPWYPDSAVRPSVRCAAAVKRAHRRQVIHDLA
jgi:hypothetical protein